MTATPSSGSTSLPHLLRSLNPTLSPTTYIYSTIPATSEADFSNILKLFIGVPVQMLFREAAGWTVVVPEDVAAEIGLEATFRCRKVTLDVHSSLEAVGFMAAVSARLAKLGMGVNPVSGYYHDHLFVPVGREHEVVQELKKMSEEHSSGEQS
ncbi:uncharacterized protein LTR77_000221 [Saxophila tyrrhenica]|uniref:DUF2241 domain-containing protein n=1 Tax=Saxophila tyrrhenica TaxID=1690608 RepID=A0AAV9PM25_9PEZI|nr:hypothetical protein LTR77_000221 [Saxophila tyrrhenica]